MGSSVGLGKALGNCFYVCEDAKDKLDLQLCIRNCMYVYYKEGRILCQDW